MKQQEKNDLSFSDEEDKTTFGEVFILLVGLAFAFLADNSEKVIAGIIALTASAMVIWAAVRNYQAHAGNWEIFLYAGVVATGIILLFWQFILKKRGVE